MKRWCYNLVRIGVKLCLYLYFGKIQIHGLKNVPQNKPVLFLSNHQNAFLDTILIATGCNRSPYFLTRASVFKNKLLKKIFTFFKMIPIYRIRDGIDSLKGNDNTFKQCQTLLSNKESIVMFPEGNHSLKRKVRPIRKGFTRILFLALQQYPDVDIYIIPVGVNYVNAANFPDKVAVYYGNALRVQEVYDKNDLKKTKEYLIQWVSNQLQMLTTHIENEKEYESIIHKLDAIGADYLQPKKLNTNLIPFLKSIKIPEIKTKKNWFDGTIEGIFYLINFPVLEFWRKVFKPRVKQIEFMSTMRFAFSVVIYPLYALFLFAVTTILVHTHGALWVIISLFAFNVFYINRF